MHVTEAAVRSARLRSGVGLMSRMSPGVLAPPHELLTPEQWKQRGREQRREVPPLSHAQWEPPPDRPDPVDILEEQARTRVPDLVPIRYGRDRKSTRLNSSHR